MSARQVFILILGAFALVAAPAATWAGGPDGVIRTVRQMESSPLMELLQARHISSQERTTAFFYEDRIEYYDDALLSDIAAVVDLPARTENGVLFSEVFLTQFRKHPGLYVVQRGWDEDGNCHTSTSRLRVLLPSSSESAGSGDFLSLGEENRCEGDPCQKCRPFDPDLGCLCEIGERCNHTVITAPL